MPGICGILTQTPREEHRAMLDRMVASMEYESFYSSGVYTAPDQGFYVGFVSIAKSFSDCMPVFNETRDLALFLTGECYVDDATLTDLKQSGHVFDPSNGSFLVHLFEEGEEMFFRGLNGWCNGLILDLRAHRAMLFNDRNGIRRLYCHEDGDTFLFAAEAKALLAASPALRKVDAASVAEFLVYDCVLRNRTYFSGVSLLPPGSVWRFTGGRVSKTTASAPREFTSAAPLGESEYVDAVEDTFRRVLPRYFRSGGVGLSLTGGLDTRMILACLHPAPGELPCYTFGGSYRDILDVRLAPRVAAAAGQPHQVLRLDDDQFLKEYPSHLERSTFVTDGLEGVDKVDMIPFCRMARAIAPNRMTGKYGSQVLKSVLGLKDRSPYEALIRPEFRPRLAEARETLASLTVKNPLTFLLQCEIPWWWNGFILSESSQGAVRSPYLDNDLIALLYRAPARTKGVGVALQHTLIARYAPQLMQVPTTGSHGGEGVCAAVRKRWFASLSALDKVFIRERLPYGMTHWIGRTDYVLSRVKADRLFTGYADRRRYRAWFRDQLSGFLRETLLCERTLSRPYWNREFLRKVVEHHIAGRGTYLREIRKVLQIEMLHRVLVERP